MRRPKIRTRTVPRKSLWISRTNDRHKIHDRDEIMNCRDDLEDITVPWMTTDIHLFTLTLRYSLIRYSLVWNC